MDAPSADGSEDLGDLWQGRPLCLRRQLSLPNLLFEGQKCVGPRMVQPPPLCVPPDRPDPAGSQANQGTRTQGSLGVTPVEEPALVVRVNSTARSSPMAHSPIAGQSVGRNTSVVRFLRGVKRLNPPRPLTVPTWDFSTVLRALKG